IMDYSDLVERLDLETIDKHFRDGGPAPVVYLRSFQDDDPRGGEATERELGSIFATLGPVVAIGRPGEGLPPLGATRVYVDNDRWQTVAADLIGRAGAIIFRVGATAGLRWELEQIGRRARPDRLFIFLSFGGSPAQGRQARYEEFLSWANRCLPMPLPAAI